ncbi:hypothetical protein FVEN_g6599 [Fusarium venenatum]|uniref:Uncharacterized protein n=1 Tax=Fusarium venenatum TaxID=56646 RepID=A0A2L2SVD4_9HYPO|nr:uncharacterized protein FVRRES_04904 [Fusarium venenatum]KAG8355720.1 hypothetical protein FVEN_g6599 [Fusarium venenatum]KAH6992035.1 hypothetical protein EDB82DRAFT_573796 [Fusarium venenatum]CEI60468.1 unnamed protein product [Fusarium venenatum]
MSEERDSPDITTEEATPTPMKASKTNRPRAREDAETIRARHYEAIKQIHPGAKKFPELYAKVELLIKGHVLGRKWTDNSLYKRFLGWADFAEIEDHPKLDMFIATMAIRDYFGANSFVYDNQVNARKLREWVHKQLSVSTQHKSASDTTALAKAQRQPRVKNEPGLGSGDAADTIRKSIEDKNGFVVPAGLKRHAQGHSSQPSNKRTSLGSDQAHVTPESNNVGMLQHSPQRIIYRERQTQTDKYVSVREITGTVQQVTATLQEQVQVLQNHNGMLGNLMERVQVTPAHPINNIAHQQQQFQAQEIFQLQPLNRQPPEFYMGPPPNRDNGNRQIWRMR